MLIFCWGFLHLYSSRILSCSFLFSGIVVWLWYKGNVDFIKCLEGFPLLQFLEEFEKNRYQIFFKCFIEFARETIWYWAFVCWEIFYYSFNLLTSNCSTQVFYFFMIQSWKTLCSHNLSMNVWNNLKMRFWFFSKLVTCNIFCQFCFLVIYLFKPFISFMHIGIYGFLIGCGIHCFFKFNICWFIIY